MPVSARFLMHSRPEFYHGAVVDRVRLRNSGPQAKPKGEKETCANPKSQRVLGSKLTESQTWGVGAAIERVGFEAQPFAYGHPGGSTNLV